MTRLTELPALIGGRPRLFLWFKLVVYLLLFANVFLFLFQEGRAFALAFPGHATLNDIVTAFSATLDTIAWWLLLVLFELETYVLSERWIRAHVWSLHVLRLCFYSIVLWAFYGYCLAAAAMLDVQPLAITDLCELADRGSSLLVGLDENEEITADNCSRLDASAPFYAISGGPVIADAATLASVRPSTWVDVINAAAWLAVVMLLELDVRLEESGRFTGTVFRVSYAAKLVVYSILALVVVYWAVRRELLDFWDAFLWFASFVLIEMNVLTHARRRAHHAGDAMANAA